MRTRIAVFAALTVLVLAGGIGAGAQDGDNLEATIAALQTRVAELEATVDARGQDHCAPHADRGP